MKHNRMLLSLNNESNEREGHQSYLNGIIPTYFGTDKKPFYPNK